jgi:retron-type reverse transcriptase
LSTDRADRPKTRCRKLWREIEAGAEWIVDAELKDDFGSIDHEKLLTLVAQRVADGRVLTLIENADGWCHSARRLFRRRRALYQGGLAS